ncbi:Telomerase Cajal body protein 1 [Cytospora mali]|uniref:Telomerase Cajal body protein 1 n=1 Tax=Cytospora mali TaxID=578113 RepID=A0A194VXP5_CYTMA|nr:Telomerase Cajal body protein 1 [Valsa mali]
MFDFISKTPGHLVTLGPVHVTFFSRINHPVQFSLLKLQGVTYCLDDKMSGKKPDVKLVASNSHNHALDGLSKASGGGMSQENHSSDDSQRDGSSSRSSSDSSSISSDGGSGQDIEAGFSTRTPSFYKSAQWTADGTTVITSSYHNQICSFVVPSDLLEPREQPLTLRPQAVLNLATATNVVAPAPYFDLLNPLTHHVLVACCDHPIQIFQALPTDYSVNDTSNNAGYQSSQCTSSLYSYPLISPQTEAYLPVHSLVWPTSHMSSSFFVGSTNLIAQFDLHRIGDGPRQVIHTIPSKRHISKGNGVGMRGTVSALSMQNDESMVPTGLLAGGTWTRWVGLYDFARGGERTATWSIAQAAESVIIEDPPPDSGLPPIPRHRHNSRGVSPIKGIGGEGINQTAWSPDGRYLLINERQSTGVLIYDVRVTNKLLGFLAGRDALTHQRLDLTVYPESEGTGGFEVWAGTRDGTVKVWQGVGNTEGCQWPAWDFPAVVSDGNDDGDDNEGYAGLPVGSVALHASGSVAATCSGCWSVPSGDDDSIASSSSSSSSSSDSSDDDPDDDEMSDSTVSSTGSKLNHSIWRTDNKRIEESSLKLWTIRMSTYDASEYERLGDSQINISQVDMHEVNVTGMDTSQVVGRKDESWNDTSPIDTSHTDAIRTMDRGHSAS